MRTAVVILNWNTERQLRTFLPGVISSLEGLDAGVVVADNGSTDGSAAYLESLGDAVRLIRLERNYGFTGGYNRALEALEAEYYVLLNSDVDTPRGWLEPLVEWMDAHPECGACGPKMLALDKDFRRTSRFEYAGAAGGYVDRFGYPFCRGRVLERTENDEGQYDSPAGVLWVSGACLMTRSALWHELGGLDERFFAHMEEIDYCWRAALRGYSIDVVPESRVWHLGGGTLAAGSPLKLKLNYRNNILLLENNLPSTIGPARAALRIFSRSLLDRAAALVYLLKGEKEYFRAVRDAHREARELSRPSGVKASLLVVRGYRRIFLLPLAFIYKDKIFKHI